MFNNDEIHAELVHSEVSRQQGNEGMARVCARRATGLALRQYIISISHDYPHLNNFEILNDASIRSLLPENCLEALEHLTMRVDLNYNLPGGIDLIADARTVIQALK